MVTFDASEGEAEPKTFLPTFEESGNLKFNHKFIGDIEELAPQGEAAAAAEGAEEPAAAE